MRLLCFLLRKFVINRVALAAALALAVPIAARAEALLLVEADSGKVLDAQNATIPWYPASLSKMMTAYVTLKAVKDGKITLDTLFTVSPIAAAQSPSKMGFRPGTQVTVDNALKMMLVKSANDMAVVLAEGVGGSIDGFSVMMNDAAQKLGMTQTSYVNPNGLPADGQITSARDLAILARAILHDLPEYDYFFHIPSIRYGRRVTQNFNKLIGRYPGADGFKTGFICASGYNLVGSATRNGRRLIAVVLGASSGRMRAVRAAQLLERGFDGDALGWLHPSLGTVDQLVPVDASPPNLRDEMCGGKHKRPSDEDEDTVAATGENGATFLAAGLQPPLPKASDLLAAEQAPSEPVLVYTGPTRTGAALLAAVAADSDRDRHATRHRGKKTRLAARRPEAKPEAAAEAKPEVKGAGHDAKSTGRPARVKHANARPDSAAKGDKGAEKPAAAIDPRAARPAKPKAAAKRRNGAAGGAGSSTGDAKAAPKSTSGDLKPAG